MTGAGGEVRAGGRASERLGWLDAAKGIGIILVVVAHVWTRGPVRDAIYAFHMPLFFLLAGYVARPKPMRAFLIAQWWTMVVPYIAFLLTLAAADQLIEQARGHAPLFRDWRQAARALLLGGTELRGPFTIFWFVPCLAVARIVQNALSLRWPSPRDPRWALAMAPCLAIGLWIGAKSDFSPLGLLSVPIALCFLWLGALWRTFAGRGMILAVALLGAVGIALTLEIVPIDMKAANYGHGIFSLAIALIFSVGIVGAAKALTVPALQALGGMTLVIMYLHVAVIHYLSPYLARPALLGLAIAFPVAVNMLLSRSSIGKRYFLGRTAPTSRDRQVESPAR